MEHYGPQRSNQLQPRFLRLPAVEQIIGVKKSTVYALLKTNEFPRPYKIGGRVVAWRVEDIEEWIRTRPQINSTVGAHG